jgi:hypothetical protein
LAIVFSVVATANLVHAPPPAALGVAALIAVVLDFAVSSNWDDPSQTGA